jgi:hypothetical protein
MARKFNFSKAVKDAAFFRQNGRCALCRRSLQNQDEYGHHVIPDQSGDPSNQEDQFLGTADNCVMICEACHWIVHEGGRWAIGAVPPPDFYEHSHPNKADHMAWSALLKREYLRIYNKKFANSAAAGAKTV